MVPVIRFHCEALFPLRTTVPASYFVKVSALESASVPSEIVPPACGLKLVLAPMSMVLLNVALLLVPTLMSPSSVMALPTNV